MPEANVRRDGTGNPEPAPPTTRTEAGNVPGDGYFLSRSLNTFWTLSTFGATTARQ
jgi:hypothetical protein